jgi:hypothetical protein
MIRLITVPHSEQATPTTGSIVPLRHTPQRITGSGPVSSKVPLQTLYGRSGRCIWTSRYVALMPRRWWRRGVPELVEAMDRGEAGCQGGGQSLPPFPLRCLPESLALQQVPGLNVEHITQRF